jgi:hypothetical protein
VRAVKRNWRYWLPLAAGCTLILGTQFAGPVLTWIMLALGFGLILDAATAMWARAGGTGNATTHRQ